MISVSTFLSVKALVEEGVARKEIARRLGEEVRRHERRQDGKTARRQDESEVGGRRSEVG